MTSGKLTELDRSLVHLPIDDVHELPPIGVDEPTAAVMVGGYNGIGIHTLLAMLNSFRGYFKRVVIRKAGAKPE